jgi:DNA-binding PadR family transcriptional regulator
MTPVPLQKLYFRGASLPVYSVMCAQWWLPRHLEEALAEQSVRVSVVGPVPKKIHSKKVSSESIIFSVFDFLILMTLVRGEMYSKQILDELANLDMPIEMPKQQVIYLRLKNLLRDGFLVSHRTADLHRVYFSLTIKGRQRLNIYCSLTTRLNKMARANSSELAS